MFFTPQTFSIFISLAVTWCPSLGPCCKSAILASAIKIHIKVVHAFLPNRHFPFSFLCLSLGVPTWILAAKSVILAGAIKIRTKVVYVFLPSRHFLFSFLWLSLRVLTWVLVVKV